MHLSDGLIRSVNRTEFDTYSKDTREGWTSITNLNYVIDDKRFSIGVFTFDTGRNENTNATKEYDLTSGPVPFKPIGRGAKIGMVLH